MVATQEKKQKTCPRETYQQFSAAKFGSGSTATVQSYQKDDDLKKELREKFHAACDSFGFDKVDAPYDATAALFADNKTLAELYNVRPKGAGSAKSGASSTAHRSGVTYDEGLACAAMVAHFKVSDALEIGLAYGHSALFTACALPADGTLVAVDPAQAEGKEVGREGGGVGRTAVLAGHGAVEVLIAPTGTTQIHHMSRFQSLVPSARRAPATPARQPPEGRDVARDLLLRC